jgi:hypothetical protein
VLKHFTCKLNPFHPNQNPFNSNPPCHQSSQTKTHHLNSPSQPAPINPFQSTTLHPSNQSITQLQPSPQTAKSPNQQSSILPSPHHHCSR